MKRRQLLASIAVGGGAVLSGCQFLPSDDDSRTATRDEQSPTTRPTTERPGTDGPTETQPTETEPTETRSTEAEEPSFQTVIDMVEDRGVDPEGNEPIDGALNEAANHGTLLEFPPGEYLVTEPLLLREVTNFGIRGTGEGHRDVRFVHPTGYGDNFLNIRNGANCLFENFTADQTDDLETNSGIVLWLRDGLVVRDVEVAGFTPTEGDSPDQKGSVDLIAHVLSSDGVGTITRFVSKGGGEVGVYPNAYPGFFSGRDHRGTLRLVDCHIQDCGATGVYASRTFGPVQVDGGRFKNNGVAQIRVAGKDSYIRNAEIVVDTAQQRTSRGSYNSVRGVWWESGEREKTGGVIENCEFVSGKVPARRGLLMVDGTTGAMTVRNCEFETNRGNFHAIYAFAPGSSSMGGTPAEPWDITIEDIVVRGTADSRAAVAIEERPGSSMKRVTLDQPGKNRDGIRIRGSPGSRIEESTIDVGRFPLRLPLGPALSDVDCRLELSNDIELNSAASADTLPTKPIRLQSNSGISCLPSFDVDDGTLVIVGTCEHGFVGGLADSDADVDGRITTTDCRQRLVRLSRDESAATVRPS